jgi:hypothetical protein
MAISDDTAQSVLSPSFVWSLELARRLIHSQTPEPLKEQPLPPVPSPAQLYTLNSCGQRG